MRHLTPVDFSITGVGGVSCDVSLKGNLSVVFVSEENEYVAELKNVLYAPICGYNLFSPSAKFDGNNRDRLGGPEGVMAAFNESVTFANRDGNVSGHSISTWRAT